MSDNKSVGGMRAPSSVAYHAKARIKAILSEIEKNGHSEASPFSIGKVDHEMKKYAQENGIQLGGDEIVMNVKQITHTLREVKVKNGKAIPGEHLAEFPIRRSRMELYHDSTNDNFIYFDRERSEKFVVHPNYRMKVKGIYKKAVNYLTASRTNAQEFTLSKLTRIK